MNETKPAIQSKTIWGLAALALPFADSLYSQIAAIPAGVLPPQVSILVSGIGLLLAFVGRLSADKPISGVVTTPVK
jgi:hypothetical protein